MEDEREFVYAPEHVTVLREEGGDTYLDALTPACDFCLDVRTRWDYPCEEFEIPEIGFASSDGWLACERCAELIEARLLPELTARSMKSWMQRVGDMIPDQLDRTARIHQGFLDHRLGERVSYG